MKTILKSVGSAVIACCMVVSCSKHPTESDPRTQEMRQIQGVVEWQNVGGPVSNATVVATQLDDSSLSVMTQSNDTGGYLLEDLSAESYKITVLLDSAMLFDSTVTIPDKGQILNIKPKAEPFMVLDSFDLPGWRITALGSGTTGLWIASETSEGTVISCHDPESFQQIRSFSVAFRANGITQENNVLWVSSDGAYGADSIHRIDLGIERSPVFNSLPSPHVYPGGIYWDGVSMWSTGSSGGGSSLDARILKHTMDEILSVEMEYAGPTDFPHSITYHSGFFWSACSYSRGYHKLSPQSMESIEVFAIPFNERVPYDVAGQLAHAGNYFWGYAYCTNHLYKMSDSW